MNSPVYKTSFGRHDWGISRYTQYCDLPDSTCVVVFVELYIDWKAKIRLQYTGLLPVNLYDIASVEVT